MFAFVNRIVPKKPAASFSLKAVASGFLFFLSLISAAPLSAGEGVWDVLFRDIPVRITTADAGLTMSFYVLKQTHEPVLRTDDGENYYSRILSRWERDLLSRNFVLCPDTALQFAPGKKFSYELFLSQISSATRVFSPDSEITGDGRCVRVGFTKPMRRYLDFLTLYEHAPTIKRDDIVEIGLGEYLPVSVRPGDIALRRKKEVPNGFSTILIHKYTGPDDPNLANRGIDDFNRMQIAAIPEWVKREYAYLDGAILQTVVLIINHPDKDIRRIVYNCMNVDSLRHALYPTWKEFVDVSNVLPVGVPGAAPGKPVQYCGENIRTKVRRPLVFINLGGDNDKQMAAFMSDFEKKTGIPVLIKRLQDKDMYRTLYQSPREYDLVVVSMGAVRPDHTAFFDYLVKADGYYDLRLEKFSALYDRLQLEGDTDERNALGAQMAEMLSSEYVLLPLLQVHRRFYYPKEIMNLTAGRGFLEYPEVAEFRW